MKSVVTRWVIPAILVVTVLAVPLEATAANVPSAAAIEKAELAALKTKTGIETSFVSTQGNMKLNGVLWAGKNAAVQSTDFNGAKELVLIIGNKLWVNANAAGLQDMFNAGAKKANQWQNTWISVPKSNSNYKFIAEGLKGKSFFVGFLPTGKVKVIGPKTVNGKPIYELVGKTSKLTGAGGVPLVVVVSAIKPYLPLGAAVSATIAGTTYASTMKVVAFDAKPPVPIAPPKSPVDYSITGMPK